MSKGPNQKLKLLYLYNIFTVETDEDHPVTVKQLIEKLSARGVAAERKAIYEDLEALRSFGLDIIMCKKNANTYYFTAQRAFEVPELRLLIDAVQASRSLTTKKTSELIEKLKNLPSRYEGAQLIKQVYTAHRPKAENESIYYSIADIHLAVEQNRQISFCYFDWNVQKQKILRHDGKRYLISPVALIWDDEHYYMLGFDEAAGFVKHYRVDRMLNVIITRLPRKGMEFLESFDAARYTSKVFGMFGGDEQYVTIKFEKRFAGAMLDRFGMDISMSDLGAFAEITVRAVLSPQFYGWILGFEGAVEIISPDSARSGFKEICEKIYIKHSQSPV